jgi:hypothetical protein
MPLINFAQFCLLSFVDLIFKIYAIHFKQEAMLREVTVR